jgi:hypothetical protein
MSRVLPSQAILIIDQLLPFARDAAAPLPRLGYAQSGPILGVLAIVDEIPGELLGVLDGRDLADLISRKAILRDFTNKSVVRGSNAEVTGEHVVAIRRLIERCPDALPNPTTTALAFVPDQAWRDSLRLDISASNHDLVNGEWKSATVLAASVVEALLLWSLQERHLQQPREIPAAITRLRARVPPFNCPALPLDSRGWSLASYVELAAEVPLIRNSTAAQARQAGDYRNLIHPARAQRLAQECTRGTALAAIAALELVVEDLTP